MTVWMVRAGAHGGQEELALERGIACIGWEQMPDLSSFRTREAIEAVIRRVYPDAGDGRVRNNAAQLHAFVNGIHIGDLVVLPLKTRSQIAIGRVTGDYRHQPELGSGANHTRAVTWLRTDLPRTALAQDLLYSLGAFLTVCRIARNDAESRIQAVLAGNSDPGFEMEPVANAAEDNAAATVAGRNIEEDAEDQILQHVIRRFKGHDMARLVDAVLQAEGYVTRLSPAGPDGGVDVLAGRGALGLDGPRLCVQVKSSGSPADVKTLRELQGSMQTFKADQGLLVSWSGVNGPADRESRHSFFSVRVWDAKELLRAIFRNYERLPEDIQAELPLKRVWALVPEAVE